MIVAGARAYAEATAALERRFVMSPRPILLSEARWRDPVAPMPVRPRLVFVPADTEEWSEWARYWRKTRGESPPQNCRFGWFFPSRFPPATDAAE